MQVAKISLVESKVSSTSLELESNSLAGSIPAGDLTTLMFLRLRDNQLTGYIPSHLGGLQALEVLALQNNKLSG